MCVCVCVVVVHVTHSEHSCKTLNAPQENTSTGHQTTTKTISHSFPPVRGFSTAICYKAILPLCSRKKINKWESVFGGGVMFFLHSPFLKIIPGGNIQVQRTLSCRVVTIKIITKPNWVSISIRISHQSVLKKYYINPQIVFTIFLFSFLIQESVEIGWKHKEGVRGMTT